MSGQPSNAYRPPGPRLITDEMADAAALRHWLKDDVEHAVLALLHGRYDRQAALHHVITFALSYAERAKMDEKDARQVAIGHFRDVLAVHETRFAAVREQMIQVARNLFMQRPSDIVGAADAVTDIARNNQVPPDYIEEAIRIARKKRT